jgi:hypothetical protein
VPVAARPPLLLEAIDSAPALAVAASSLRPVCLAPPAVLQPSSESAAAAEAHTRSSDTHHPAVRAPELMNEA